MECLQQRTQGAVSDAILLNSMLEMAGAGSCDSSDQANFCHCFMVQYWHSCAHCRHFVLQDSFFPQAIRLLNCKRYCTIQSMQTKHMMCVLWISVLLPYHQSLCVMCIVIYVYHTCGILFDSAVSTFLMAKETIQKHAQM